MNIYVGNMPYAMSADELKAAFAAYGNVTSVRLVTEMPEAGEANAAIEGLNGTMQGGRALVVNEARPREDRPRGERRGGFGGGPRGERRGGFGGPRGERRGGFGGPREENF